MSQDFTLAPVHAHVNLVGWVSMFLAGLFYRSNWTGETRLAALHFGLALIGMAGLAAGLTGIQRSMAWGVPVVAVGAVASIAGMAAFAANVFRGTRRKELQSQPE